MEGTAAFSPDGSHIAYASNVTGKWHLYVKPFPGPGMAVQVTTEGSAIGPVWHPSGRELYFASLSEQAIKAIAVRTEPEFEILSKPRTLFTGDYEWWTTNLGGRNYDVSPDGETFMMIEQAEDVWATRVEVILNWTEELKRLVPVDD